MGVSYSYSRLIHALYKKQVLLNRKILAQIAILNKNCLYMISNEIIKEVDWKESLDHPDIYLRDINYLIKYNLLFSVFRA